MASFGTIYDLSHSSHKPSKVGGGNLVHPPPDYMQIVSVWSVFNIDAGSIILTRIHSRIEYHPTIACLLNLHLSVHLVFVVRLDSTCTLSHFEYVCGPTSTLHLLVAPVIIRYTSTET